MYDSCKIRPDNIHRFGCLESITLKWLPSSVTYDESQNYKDFCSLAGALVFCGLESGPEDVKNDEEVTLLVRRSVAAKKELVDKIQVSCFYIKVNWGHVVRLQMMFFANSDAMFFNETELRKAIDRYDVSMAMKPVIHREKRWNLWGGLYYAGTIYTTIGEWRCFLSWG